MTNDEWIFTIKDWSRVLFKIVKTFVQLKALCEFRVVPPEDVYF